LSRNLDLGKDVVLTGSGAVDADEYLVNIDLYSKSWTSTIRWNATGGVLHLGSGLNVTSEMTFSGDWIIHGYRNEIDLKDTGNIVVASGSTLHFKNLMLKNVCGNNIRCFDDSAKIIFDDNSVIMDADYSFTVGSLEFFRGVEFKGVATFFYESGLTSTINKYTNLRFYPDTSFSLGRKEVNGREPLYFQDRSAELMLDNATLVVTTSGMRLTRGKVILNRSVDTDLKSTSSTNGLMLGDGTIEGDVILQLNSGATINIPKGHVVYDAYMNNAIQSPSPNTMFIAGSEFKLYLNNNILFQNIMLDSSPGWTLTMQQGKTFLFKDYKIIFGDTIFQITGKRLSEVSNLLDGDGEIDDYLRFTAWLDQGFYPGFQNGGDNPEYDLTEGDNV